MMSNMFKTIHDCRVEIVAHTIFPEDGVDEGGWDNSDWLPVSAARASFGKEDKTGEDEAKDLKLVKYLAEHKHMTPFEYQHATFLVECPLFIRSQIHRHRTFSFNEISRRYTSEQIEFWIPDKWRKQSDSNKQASTSEYLEFDYVAGYGESMRGPDTMHIPGGCVTGKERTEREYKRGRGLTYMRAAHLEILHLYEDMVSAGICREQARAVLPQSLITRFYMGGNLRNWAHFVKLRKDSHAQAEVRVIAERIEKKLRELWPNSVGALLGEDK